MTPFQAVPQRPATGRPAGSPRRCRPGRDRPAGRQARVPRPGAGAVRRSTRSPRGTNRPRPPGSPAPAPATAKPRAESGPPSGIGPMVNDECQIDPAVFQVFVTTLPARHRGTGHAVVPALFEGFTVTVLVLAQRAGVRVDWARLGAASDGPLEDVQVSALTGMSVPPEGEAWASRLREKAREMGRFTAC
ncbi:DUF6086 family protein [Streptomyces roseolilacinus]|uniref:DUF6086 family protein n=1 Tax=Streptomyces roseolilacinus TaxID=66904 RepID=UPI00380F1CA3